MGIENADILGEPGEIDEGKFRDEYDEDFLTVEPQVTGMVKVVLHSHDGYGVATERHVYLNPDTAEDFAKTILYAVDD